jgi:signal recognition particle subunit SRP54
MGTEVSPVEIAKQAIEKARRSDCNLVILDTAGRLQIDEELMEELTEIRQATKPSEILLVVDAMTGQDAVNVAKGFDERLSITGVALTKLDGDTRGGAALSIRAVTGKPIKLVGVGEKLEDVEVFHGDRMANRILGMGDILTMIEKAQEAIDQEEAAKLSKRITAKDFNLEDFLDSMSQMKKMGGIGQLMGMLPGMGGKMPEIDEAESERTLARTEAMIRSMTPQERRKPQILDASRKRRIVRGSGCTIQELNRMLKQFEQSKTMMKQLSGMKGKRRFGGFGGKMPFGF